MLSSGVKKDGNSNHSWPYIMFLFWFWMPSTLYFNLRLQ